IVGVCVGPGVVVRVAVGASRAARTPKLGEPRPTCLKSLPPPGTDGTGCIVAGPWKVLLPARLYSAGSSAPVGEPSAPLTTAMPDSCRLARRPGAHLRRWGR